MCVQHEIHPARIAWLPCCALQDVPEECSLWSCLVLSQLPFHDDGIFFGIRWHGSERLLAMALPATGAAFYVCPGFEEGRAREQLANGPDGKEADVRIWQEDESPYERVAQGLKDRGIATGMLGMEESV